MTDEDDNRPKSGVEASDEDKSAYVSAKEDGEDFVEEFGEASFDYFQEFHSLSDKRRRGLNALFEEGYEPEGAVVVAAQSIGQALFAAIGLSVLSVGAYASFGVVGSVGAALFLGLLLGAVLFLSESDVDATEAYPEVYDMFVSVRDDVLGSDSKVDLAVIESENHGALAKPRGFGGGEIAVSTETLEELDRAELERVLRHEAGHLSGSLAVWTPLLDGSSRVAVLLLPAMVGMASLQVLALMVGLLVGLRVVFNFVGHWDEVRADEQAVGGGTDIEYAEALLKLGPVSRTDVSFVARWIEILFGSPHPPLAERVEQALGSGGSIRVPSRGRASLLKTIVSGVATLLMMGGMGLSVIALLSFVVGSVPFVWSGYGVAVLLAGLWIEGVIAGVEAGYSASDGMASAIGAGVGALVMASILLAAVLGLFFGIGIVVGSGLLSVLSWVGAILAVLLELLILFA